MKLVIQRASRSSVCINGGETRSCKAGLAVLFAAGEGDTLELARLLADKTANLRIFSDGQGKMNLSLLDTGGEALVVPNFTLFADTKKGRRPSFARSGSPEFAKAAYELYVSCLASTGIGVKTGEFAADMQLELVNDGPVTIIMDTQEWGL